MLGSRKTRSKFLSPANVQIKDLSKSVKAMTTVRTAGKIYNMVTRTRKGDKKVYAWMLFFRFMLSASFGFQNHRRSHVSRRLLRVVSQYKLLEDNFVRIQIQLQLNLHVSNGSLRGDGTQLQLDNLRVELCVIVEAVENR